MINRRYLTFILLFSFFEWLGISYFSGYFHFWFTTPELTSDPKSYFDAAKDLIYRLHPDQIRPLGISALFSIPLVVTDSLRFFIVVYVILQLGAWLLTVYLLYLSCRMIYSEKESMAATFLFAIAISPIAMTFIIMSETYFTFFLVFAFYFFILFWKSGKNYFLLLSYFLFCFATIIRPLTYYLALLFTLILIIYFLKKSFASTWRSIVFTLLIFVSTIGVQLSVMHATYNVWTLSDTMGKVMWMWSAHAECLSNGRTDLSNCVDEWMNEAVKQLQAKGGNLHDVIKDRFIDLAKTNPIDMVKAYLISLKYNLIGGSYSLHLSNYFSEVMYALSRIQNIIFSFLLFLAAIVLAGKTIFRKISSVSMLIGLTIFVCLYLYLMGGLFYWQGDRYNIPAFPLICFILPFLFDTLKNFIHEVRNRSAGSE